MKNLIQTFVIAFLIATPLADALALQCTVSDVDSNGDGTERCSLQCADGSTPSFNAPAGTCHIGDPYILKNFRKNNRGFDDINLLGVIL